MAVLPAGTLLHNDRFEIQTVLGRGGFGITYEALDRQNGRLVAIKEFFPLGSLRAPTGEQAWQVQPGGLLTTESFARAREQFLESARALTRFRHPGIVRVYEFWEANGTAYMVMERLCGRTLLDVVEENGPLPIGAALHITEHIGEALAAIHRLELLHLDIKPENIMVCLRPGKGAVPNAAQGPIDFQRLDEEARVVLFDFDLLQRLETTGGYRTRPLIAHSGTPGYAALEQYTEHAQFGRFTDIYALGATFYHLLTGQAPPAATDRAHDETGTIWKPPRQIVPELDARMDDAISWSLEMSSRQRPQEVSDWLHALIFGRPLPDIADESDGSSAVTAPIAPAQPDLPQTDGWFRLAVTDLELDWPQQCACCLRPPETVIGIKGAKRNWPIPYCYRCSRHVVAANQAVTMTTAGMIVGLLIALIGFILANIILSPLGVIIHFSAMAYGALKVQASEAIMRSSCCDRKVAVGFGGQLGRRYFIHFKNLAYANDFRNLNSSKMV